MPGPADRALPAFVAHYAAGPPFRSVMDLDDDARAEVLRAGQVSLPARFADPTYLPTRARVEAELRRQFRAAGGEPLRLHPHYALLGRSARAERTPGRRVHLLPLARLPEAHTSFTWGDSFLFDPEHRRLRGVDHPASGAVYRLHELETVLRRWEGSTGRPGWQELEIQLWFDPDPGTYSTLETVPSAG